MQVKSIAECSKGEHYAILSSFIKLQFVIKIFVLSGIIFEWPFTQVLLYTGPSRRCGTYRIRAQYSLKTSILQYPVQLGLNFGLRLHLYPYFACESNIGFAKTVSTQACLRLRCLQLQKVPKSHVFWAFGIETQSLHVAVWSIYHLYSLKTNSSRRHYVVTL